MSANEPLRMTGPELIRVFNAGRSLQTMDAILLLVQESVLAKNDLLNENEKQTLRGMIRAANMPFELGENL